MSCHRPTSSTTTAPNWTGRTNLHSDSDLFAQSTVSAGATGVLVVLGLVLVADGTTPIAPPDANLVGVTFSMDVYNDAIASSPTMSASLRILNVEEEYDSFDLGSVSEINDEVATVTWGSVSSLPSGFDPDDESLIFDPFLSVAIQGHASSGTFFVRHARLCYHYAEPGGEVVTKVYRCAGSPGIKRFRGAVGHTSVSLADLSPTN